MVNLDAKGLRYMSTDEMRVLTAVEQGMKNHEYVPSSLIEVLAGLKRGGAFKVLRLLAKHKLVQHESVPQESFRLTNKGYDWLALRALSKRGSVEALGIRIGMGKESDIYTCTTAEGEEICIKLHRLGRNCFRTVKNNRDYLKANQSASWLYLSRLSSLKEYAAPHSSHLTPHSSLRTPLSSLLDPSSSLLALRSALLTPRSALLSRYAFMKALYDKGFPTPTPIDVNRHCVLMTLSHSYQLNSIAVLRHPGRVFSVLMELVVRLAGVGLIHCDFNEFNLLVDDNEVVTMIDFPQMVSTSHINAKYYFDRDVDCIRTFFKRRFGFCADAVPTLEQAMAGSTDKAEGAGIDDALRASGWNAAQEKVLGTLRELDEREGEKLGKLVEEGEEMEEEEEEEEAAAVGEAEGEEEDESEEDESEDEEAGGAGEAAAPSRFVLSMTAAAPDRVALRYQLRAEAEAEEEAEEAVGDMACSLADVGLSAEEKAEAKEVKGVALRRAAAGQRAAGLGQLSTRRQRPAASNAVDETESVTAEDTAARVVKPRKKAAAPVIKTKEEIQAQIADRVKQERGRGGKVKYAGRNEMKNRESRKTMSQLKSDTKDMGIY